MASYPLEFGSHTDPDTADEFKTTGSSPATDRYPLEWGAHLDETENNAPVAPVFTPVMPTLLGGAHPDSFPFASPAPAGFTLVDSPSGGGNISGRAILSPPDSIGAKEPLSLRGTSANVEPPANSPELEKSFQDWPGVLAKLPDGSPIPNPYSENGYLMSPFADLTDVAAAGRRSRQVGIGIAPGVYDYLRAMNANVGQGGAFDYQRRHYPPGRDGFTQLRQFRDVSNFNAGLYAQQAGLGLEWALRLAGGYAGLFSSNARPSQTNGLDPRTKYFIELGHSIGQSGVFDGRGK